MTDIAAELPLQVILEMMGVPVEDRHQVFDWSNRMIGFDDPEYQTSPEDGRAAATEMFMYANKLAVDRKRSPQADVISTLMRAELDGEALTETEFDAFFVLLSVAGNETTRNLISGGMLALIEHPEQRDKLIDDPSLIPTAVDEMLRWVTPVIYFRRTVTRDTEIRGQKIREGEKVVMYYGSGNRDEDVFPDGDLFDVARRAEPAHHVRPRRRALLPRRQPGAAGDTRHVRGAAAAVAGHRAGGAGAAACARTSSPASSTCRCGFTPGAQLRTQRTGSRREARSRLGDSIRRGRAVAFSAAGIPERFARDRNELPVIAGRDVASSGSRRRWRRPLPRCGEREGFEASVTVAACAHDELAEPVVFIQKAVRGLRGESLVVVFVPIHNHIRSEFIKRSPERE